ncbi:helix-turn-helix domain-containing protein [Methylobacterium sp. WL18]|uniref:helix-turn-helix domain-containing protein n=1 Tax=Methylobacterium sp. WL18 TaxID=2603897 RepID=UPI0011C7A0C4|nr:helix-turn-helix domain-containing protein [Methylobacterium sp. WL18]TXN75096.1 helix-turn-helix domain-containing protein [Methylobacterium sp. WL18]
MIKAYRVSDLVAEGLICRSTIYNLIRRGDLRAKKIGRATVVTADDWQAMLDRAPVAQLGARRPEQPDSGSAA